MAAQYSSEFSESEQQAIINNNIRRMDPSTNQHWKYQILSMTGIAIGGTVTLKECKTFLILTIPKFHENSKSWTMIVKTQVGIETLDCTESAMRAIFATSNSIDPRYFEVEVSSGRRGRPTYKAAKTSVDELFVLIAAIANF